MKLEKILEKHIGPGEHKELTTALMKWYNTELLLEDDKDEVIERLITRINAEFGVDCREINRAHPFLAARFSYFSCVKKLFPKMPHHMVGSYVNKRSHATSMHVEKTMESFFSAYPKFKPSYNRIAKRYKVEKL